MTGCIDTETIHTHLDKAAIALYEIICYVVVLGIQIHTVACNLSPPAIRKVPVEVTKMVPVVVNILVLTTDVLQQAKTTLILLIRDTCKVVGTQLLLVRNHTSIDECLSCQVGITVELLAECLLTEVTSVIEYDVENNLDTLGMCLVDEFLEHGVTVLATIAALITAVNMLEIHSMITVVVVTGCVLHYWCNPDSSKTQCLDVVELVDDTLEVASPARVFCCNLLRLVVPAEHIVSCVTIVETRGHHKIDTFVSEVSTIAGKRVCSHRLHGDQHEHEHCP